MKNRLIILIVWTLAAMLGVACEKMNDIHDEYLKNGPIVYIGRVDSMYVYSGRERVQVDYWITDPRAKELCFYWNNKKDSARFAVSEHNPSEVQTLIIDPISEGDFTFQVFSYDGKGHRSIKFEQGFSVYGDVYSSTLNNRALRSVTVGVNKLTLTWGNSSSIQEQAVYITYTSPDGAPQTMIVPSAYLAGATVLENVDLSLPVTYCTVYLPNEQAIDYFFSETAVVPVG